MENAIRARRAHFSLLFCWKSNLGLSWKHLRSILGSLGKIFGSFWVPKTPPRCAKIRRNRPQEPPQRRLEIVRCAKTAPRCLKMPPRRPKTPPRRAKPQEITHQDHQKTPTRPPQGPPEIIINWRGGTKAQPSSIQFFMLISNFQSSFADLTGR